MYVCGRGHFVVEHCDVKAFVSQVTLSGQMKQVWADQTRLGRSNKFGQIKQVWADQTNLGRCKN